MQIALLEAVIVQPGAELSTNSTVGGSAASNAPDGLFAELLAVLTGLVGAGEGVEVSDAPPEDEAPGDTGSSEIDTLAAAVIAAATTVVPVSPMAMESQAEGEELEETAAARGSSLADRILLARANLTALPEGPQKAAESKAEPTNAMQATTVAASTKGTAPGGAMVVLTATETDGSARAELSGRVSPALVAKAISQDRALQSMTEPADQVAGREADSTPFQTEKLEPPPATRSRADTFVEAMLRSLLRSERGEASGDKSAVPQSVQHGHDQPVIGAVEPRADRIVSGTDLLADPGKPVPATPQGLRDATIRSVRYLVGHGEQSLRVRLVPASLGELHVTVTTSDDGGLNVHLTSAHHAVRETLDGQLSGLRDALARDGIDVGRITVSPHMGTDTGSTPSGDRQPAGQPWRSGREDGEGYPNSGQHGGRQRQFVHEGALDLLA